MNMEKLLTSIVDLPDEVLLHILKKIHHLDVLYSLVGSNERLDHIACDQVFTQSIDLTNISSDEKNDSEINAVFDRFSSHILPRIDYHIRYLIVNGRFLERILHRNSFSNLQKITLTNVDISLAFSIFNEQSPFIVKLKSQISQLVVTIDFVGQRRPIFSLLVDIYHRIFSLLPNVKYLDLDVNNDYLLSKSLLNGTSTTCYSSSITHLRVKMHNIDDCLCLLDGRLSQLHTLDIKLECIHDSSLLRSNPSEMAKNTSILFDNAVSRSNRTFFLRENCAKYLAQLKCFSLFVCLGTNEFDTLIVSILRRMILLEKLSLSLRVTRQSSFVNCADLENSFLQQLPYLHTFLVDIVTEYVILDELVEPPFDDIRRTFIERGYHVDGYIECKNYMNRRWGRCHVYSLPFHLEHMQQISHGFPGGIFVNVVVLWVRDEYDPFERSFFAKISRSFPSLRRLVINNEHQQTDKSEETSLIIKFSHLVELDYGRCHINYIEQFLSGLQTCAPSLRKLRVHYQDLVAVTENFTRYETRVNCAKLKSITFSDGLSIAHSKAFYLYFPLL